MHKGAKNGMKIFAVGDKRWRIEEHLRMLGEMVELRINCARKSMRKVVHGRRT